jgi:hypothetical protein
MNHNFSSGSIKDRGQSPGHKNLTELLKLEKLKFISSQNNQKRPNFVAKKNIIKKLNKQINVNKLIIKE